MTNRYSRKPIVVLCIFAWVLLCAQTGMAVRATPNAFPYKNIGDGLPATSVTLTLVDGIAVGPEGDIYLSHRSKNRIRKITSKGVITTVAGNGIAGFSGDGGPATEASLNFPAGLAFDRQGNLYVADRNNHRVRKIDTNGIITTVAGNGKADMDGDLGPATEASLNYPSGLVCDDAGNLYIADRSNNRIRKVSPSGEIDTIAGLGFPGYGGDFGPAVDALLHHPFGIDLDSAGNMYIADRGNNRVRKIDTRGIITTVAGDGMHSFSGEYGPANRASLAFPTDVLAGANGEIYISDRNNNRIRKVDRLGIITTVMGTGQADFNGDNEIATETNLHLPFALALDKGKLLVVDRSHFRVRSLKLNTGQVTTIAGSGKYLFRGDGGIGSGANLNSPNDLIVDGQGNVIFADKQHHRLRKVDKNGIITTLAGNGFEGVEGDGEPALEAALKLPSGLAIDKAGTIYLAQRAGSGWRIRKIDASGKITHFAGDGQVGIEGDGGPALKASFYEISDIAVNNEGELYIADRSNLHIRKITLDGKVQKVAEEAWKKLKGEEIHPISLAFDREGNLYFGDEGSSKIRKIDRQGNITHIAGSGDFEDSGDEGPALLAGVRSPTGLAFSPAGELYIAEERTHRIRKIDANGIIHRVAGTGEPGFSGDGGPALKAQLKSPYRLSFDSQGNLYFSDRDDNLIRKIDPEGIITTVAGNKNIGWLQDGLEVRITVHNFP